jgi:tRNA pseudouridine38-40 synthase
VTHYRLTLAYDGTDFAGFQAQARGRTVQDVLEGALARLADGGRVPIAAAGRTDAGVHALGQVVCFKLPREMEPERVLRALNGLLPGDVRVRAAALAAPQFHARRSATAKLYRYEIDTGPVQLPTRRRYAGHVHEALDQTRVHDAARLYRGRHDFASLASSGGTVKTTVRTVTRSTVSFSEGSFVYEVEADGFLRKMVRSLVGGLLAAGRGTMSVEGLRQALLARDRSLWPAPADARGLFLVRVTYPETPPAVLP